MVRKNKVIFVSSVVILLSVCPADSQRLRYQQKNDFRSNVRLVHGGGDVVPMTSDESLGDNSFPVLPLCCDMVKDDVVSYQCQNTLGKSSQEVLFKRKTWVAPGHLVSNKKTLKFKFVSTSLFCKNEIFSANLPLTRPHMPKQSRSSYFSPDGYFKHQNEYYRPDEYCISGLNENRLQVKICRANCSNPATPCIQKCCGIHQIYSFGYGDNPRGCVDVGSHKPQWFPTLYHDLTTKLSPEDLSALNPHIIHKFPTTFKFNCRFNKTTVFPHSTGISDFLTALTSKTFRNLEFRLRKDGWLLYPGDHHSGVSAKRIDNYCVDGAQDYGESSEFGNLEGETVLFLCSGGVDEAFEIPIVHNRHPLQQKQNGSKLPGMFNTISQRYPSPPPAPPTTTNTRPPPPPSTTTTPPLSSSTPTQRQPNKKVTNFKDRIDLDMTDSSSSTSLEIEIEDGVPLNSVEIRDDDGGGRNPESEKFIPAVLKVAVPVPQDRGQSQSNGKNVPGLLQTTFNHNNFKNVDHERDTGGSSGIEFRRGENANKSPSSGPWTLPTCCNFDAGVNDGLTHHCRNKRMTDKVSNESRSANSKVQPLIQWNVPEYFTTRGKSAQFLLRQTLLKCGTGKFQFQGFMHSFEQVKSKTSGEKRHGILTDGYLKYDNEFYSPEQYCVNGLSTRIIEVLICKPDCSMWETPCIKKCCGLDEIYNLGLNSGNRGCQPLHPKESKFSPILYRSMSLPVSPDEMRMVAPHFVQKYPPNFQQTCYNKITLAFPYSQEIAEKLTPANSAERGGTSFKHLKFRFRKDGKLMYSYPDSDGTSFDAVFDRGEFCVDAVRDYGEREHFRNNENQTVLFICASEPHHSAEHGNK